MAGIGFWVILGETGVKMCKNTSGPNLRAHHRAKSRRLSHHACVCNVLFGLGMNPGKNSTAKKSQKRNISRMRGGALCQSISMTFGIFLKVTDVINCANFGVHRFNGLRSAKGQSSSFPIGRLYGLYNSALHYRAGM